MRVTLHTKLISAFVLVVLIPSVVGMLVALNLIEARVTEQAEYKISTDLNLARNIFNDEQITLKDTAVELQRTARVLLNNGRMGDLRQLLVRAVVDDHFSIALVTDAKGRVIYRGNTSRRGDFIDGDFFVRRALAGQTTSGIQIASPAQLRMEGLTRQAVIRIVPTSRGYPVEKLAERRGMLIKVATPMVDSRGGMSGVLVAAILVNRDYEIVDRIRRESRGDSSTIFLGPVRIATNVERSAGARAVGTVISEPVGRTVLDGGRRFVGEAWVVNTPYISAYEPIRDVEQNIVGMIYVGTPQSPFLALKRRTIGAFGAIVLVALAVALSVGLFGAFRIAQPLEDLADAAQRIGRGDFTARAQVTRRDEVGVLCSEFNSMAEKLQSQIEELNRLSELKSEFIAIASHELRTPVTLIRSYVELINRGTYDASPQELKERLSKVERNTVRLSSLLNDLLDLSRLEHHELIIHREELSVRELLEDVLSDIAPTAELKELVVTKTIPDDLMHIYGDEERLRRVFFNLLDNSMKFTKAGDHIRISAKPVDRRVEVHVEDSGAGIAAEDLPFVFSPFFQTEASIHRTHSGLGLGLSLAKNIIELHGGTISIESELGKGTTATVRLPFLGNE